MKVTTALPPPASPLRAEAVHGDLEARILRAEQRLVAREQDLHRGIQALGLRLRQMMQPRRLLKPALGVTAALIGVLWLSRSRRSRAAPRLGAAAAAPAPRLVGSWTHLAGLAWPMLPSAWRARVNPTLANLMISTGLPWLERLVVRPAWPPLPTTGPVARARLGGHWYELARLPGSGASTGPQRWQHRLREDGGIDLLHERGPARGQDTRGADLAGGVAMVLAGSGGTRWRVSHWPAALRWLPLAWHQEAVLHADDAATELMLGSPGRDRLRLLARQPSLPRARLEAMLRLAAERGYAVERLRFPDEGAGTT